MYFDSIVLDICKRKENIWIKYCVWLNQQSIILIHIYSLRFEATTYLPANTYMKDYIAYISCFHFAYKQSSYSHVPEKNDKHPEYGFDI